MQDDIAVSTVLGLPRQFTDGPFTDAMRTILRSVFRCKEPVGGGRGGGRLKGEGNIHRYEVRMDLFLGSPSTFSFRLI